VVDKPKDKSNDVASGVRLWSLASEIGFKIAVPLLVFMLVGIWLDRTLNSKPIFMLFGVLLALASSAFLVAQMIKAANEEQA
jgi:F0F1-type ATP synthase assembly protein I